MTPPSNIASKVKKERNQYYTVGHYFASLNVEAFDYRIKKLMLEHPDQDTFPAVDLISKYGAVTSLFALRFQTPAFPATCEFHPFDFDPHRRIKPGLEHQKEVAATEEPLFEDPNGVPVFSGDAVFLKGLKNEAFNNREAQVLAKDKNQEGRIAVKLLTDQRTFESKNTSIKQENLCIPGDELERYVYRNMGKDGQQAFYQGLLDRVSPWNGISSLQQRHSSLLGKCALVTCLDSKSSYPRSERHKWWMEAMEAASLLLMKGGCLLLLGDFADLDSNDGYGNIGGMENFAYQRGWNMTMQAYNDNFFRPPESPEKVAMLWMKVDRYYNRMAEMDSMGDPLQMMRAIRWHPKVPPDSSKDAIPDAD